MPLDINKVKLPYTPREIVEREYPKFWKLANECEPILRSWQETVVDLLPNYKKGLPSSESTMKTNEQKLTLLNYFKLRIVYSMASTIWEQINEWGRELANDTNNNGCKLEIQDNLQNLYEHIISFRKEIITDDVTGYFRLIHTVDIIRRSYISPIPVVSTGNGRRHRYDAGITRPIKDGELKSLVKVTYKCTDDPTEPNINGFMDTPEDNKLVRIY